MLQLSVAVEMGWKRWRVCERVCVISLELLSSQSSRRHPLLLLVCVCLRETRLVFPPGQKLELKPSKTPELPIASCQCVTLAEVSEDGGGGVVTALCMMTFI